MTTTRVLGGLVLGTVALAPVGAGAWALRRRFLPGWSGALGRLVELLIALSIVLCVLEVVGLVGLYDLVPAVVALAVAGTVAAVWSRRTVSASASRSGGSPPAPPSILGRTGSFIAVAATAVLVASWTTRTIDGLRNGMSTIDSLWYHMPTAARFVQSGSIGALHYTDGEPVTVFFPANSPLVHGLGILLLHNDSLSPLLNLGWLALALLAGWCIGRPTGVAPSTLAGTAVVLATPGFVATQPGGGYTDIVGLALLLGAVAIIVNVGASGQRLFPAAMLIGGLAAGWALGAKFTFIGPVAALTVAVLFLAARGSRARLGAIWFIGLALTGALWYVRNLVTAGNPLPQLSIGIGPLALPTKRGASPTFTVASNLLSGHVWRSYYVPGLDRSLGPAWFAIAALAIAGLVAGAASGQRVARALAFVGFASLVAYAATPQFLGLKAGEPIFFVFNVRYVSPALALGLVTLPIVPAFARRGRARWVLGAYALVMLATQLDPTIWPTDLGVPRFAEPIRGIDSVAGILAGIAVLAIGTTLLFAPRRTPRPRMTSAPAFISVAAAGALVFVVGAIVLGPVSRHDRYRDTPSLPVTYAWAQHIADARIGVVGAYAQLQYPLYGADLSNYVQYVGRRGDRGSFGPLPDCAAWRRALNAGRYDYLFIGMSGSPNAPSNEQRWTESDPAARLLPVHDDFVQSVFGRIRTNLYKLTGPLDPAGCADRDSTGSP